MATTYEVELYQINCSLDGAGESGIILLVSVTGFIRKLVKAVLIDTGYGLESVKKISASIKTIRSSYGDFKFDAFVMSHWDEVS
jgi:hypothetical protein